MDFEFTDDQKLFQKSVRTFAEKEIEPIARDCDERREFPMEIVRKLGDLGYLGAKFPVEYGGTE